MKTYSYNKIKRSKREVFLKILMAAVSFFIIFLLTKAILKIYFRSWEISGEKAQIQSEIERLEQRKKDLEAKLSLYQNPDFLEKEARKKFNLQKEGEQAVVILPNEEEKSKLSEQNQNKTWLALPPFLISINEMIIEFANNIKEWFE